MQPQKQGYRRLICLLLCAAMLASFGVTAFAEQAAERALVLDYGFESIENGVVEDRSGNQFDGQLFGDQAALAGGVTGNGLALNGGYVRIPAKAIQGLTDVTISAQVYIKNLTPHSDYKGEAAIVKPTTLLFAGVADRSKSYAMLNTQSFDFDTFHEGCGWTISTPSYKEVRMAAAVDQHPAKGKWSDLAMVQEGTTVRVYLDGQLVREQTGVTAHLGDVYVDENTPVYIGRSDWRDFAPDGVIDNFRIYNYAMTAEELPRTDLVLDYEFEALEDGKVRDLSGNGFDGEVAGTAALTEAATGMGLNLEGAGDYVRVPAAVLKDLTDASIVGQVKLSSLKDVTGLFAGGSASGTFMSLNAKGIYAPDVGYQEGFTYAIQGKSGTQRRLTAKLEDVVPAGEWCTFAWVQSGSTVSLYLNGTLVATGDVGGDTLHDIYVNDKTELYLGKPLDNWGDPKSYGIFDSFRIYSRALDVSEIPGKPVEPEPPYVPTPFEEQVDYIQRAVNYLMNDGDALPQAKLDGVSVAWTLLEGDAEIRDGKLCKTETSQERQPVRLKAEVSMEGEQTQTLTFDHVTLMDPYVGYILSFFGVATDQGTGSSAENFRIAYSYDGMHWSSLNGNEPVVKPTNGSTRRVRDPFIMRSKDGSFTLMATQGWDTPYLYFWHSDRLTDFDNERLLKATTAGAAQGLSGWRAWAPEGLYDPITDLYYVYWSDPDAPAHATYYNSSADLESLSEPGILFQPGSRHLDANIIKYDGTYYLDYRNYAGAYNDKGVDGIRIAKAEHFKPGEFKPFTEDVNPWRSDSAAEGSFMFKVNGENRWYLYWDYNDIFKFGVMETTDLSSGEWTFLGINGNMPHSVVRHGGSTPVTQKELEAILSKWNPDGEKLKISEVATLAESELTVTESKQLSELNLPKTVAVTLSNGMQATADIAWESSDYQSGVNGSYTLTGKLSLSEAEKAKIPSASGGTLTVNDNNKTVSMTCVVSLTAVEEPSMLLHYDFTGDTGSTVTDKVGNYNGELTTANGGEAKLISGANRDGGQAAEFVRGSVGQQGGYLEIPAKAFADAGSELTLNMWVKLDDLPNWTQLMSIGTDRTHYFVLAASGNPYGKGVGLTAAMKNGGAEERIAAPQSATVTPGQWAMVTYVQSATSAALYVNGQKLETKYYDAGMNERADGREYLKMSVATIAGLEGAKAQLGRSICFSDNNLDGMVGEVQLYRGALSDEAISKLMSSGAENSKQVLHYDFVGDTGTTATDKAGSYDGTLKTAIDGEAKFDAAANIGGGQALELVRGASGQKGGYVEVPVGALKEAGRELTVNLWVKPDDNLNWNQLFGVGSDSTHYALLASNGDPYGKKVGLTVALRNGGSEERIAAPSGVTLTTGEWNMVTYVESESYAALYLNGQKLDTKYYDAQVNARADGSEYLKLSFAAVAAAANASAQIGRSPCFTDNNFDGIVGDFALYQGALTGAEIEKLYSEKTAQLDEDAIRQTKEYLKKTYNGTETKTSLTLPVIGVKGTQIEWTASSNAAVMAPDGTLVSHPDADTRITLTAKLRCGKAEGECEIEVNVIALTAARMAEEDAVWAAEYLDFIVNDTQTTLPETAPYGAALTWSVTSGHGEIRDGVLYKTEGAAENEPLTLSVKAAINGAEKTAPVTGLILKDAYVGQIMSYFTNSADDRGMKLSYTYDLKNFMPLNNGKAVVAMTQGTKRMRDPSVFRLKDGTFGVVSTQGWDNPSIYVVDSPDLCSFENEHLVKVANGSRAWAPECNYDRLTGQYIVYWSDPGRDGGYIRYNTSPDLVTFSAEQKYIGFDYSVIDASIKWAKGKYYMAIKREDGDQQYANGGYGTLIMASADRLTGPWTCSEEFIAGKLASNNASKQWCEGPTWSKSYADGLYYMYFDEAWNRDVIFATNTDMADDSGWKYHDDSEYGGIAAKKIHGNTESLDDADKRTSHCGITDVTQKELDRLIAKWGVTSEAYGIWFTILNAKDPEAVEAVKGTAFDALELPETVSVQYDDGGWRDAAVTWDENGYDASADSCELTGTIVLADDVKNSKNITVTCVVRLTAVNKSELGTAITAAEGKKEADYCAESWSAMQKVLAAAKTVYANETAAQTQVDTATANLNNALTALQAHTWNTAWSSDADNHWHECSNCHAKKGEDAHDWSNKDGVCKNCQTKCSAAHNPGTTCSVCGKYTPIPVVTPSEPAKNPFNPNAGSNTAKFPFVDVLSDSWYYSSVQAAWENGLIDGVTANEFKPNATLTVAQTIKLAAALHQLDRTDKVSLTNGGANWYDSYVNYAVVNGIIEKDYANYTKAQMNAPVTRGEFVHIFHGAEEAYKAINTVADNAIPDVKTTDKFAPEIYEFYRAGILTGSDEKGTFHSASTIKRSEAAAILLRMFEASARKSITLN